MTGSKSKSTSQTGSAQAWAQPYATSAAKQVIDTNAAAQPNLDQVMANNTALGQQLTTNFGNAGNVGQGASDYYGKVMSGKYLNSNPYLQGVLDSGSQDITDNVNSQFTSAGRYGSGAHTDVLANALAEFQNQVRYGDYATERGYMNDAASGSISAEQARVQAQQAAAQQLLAQQAMAAELPYVGTNNLANSLGTLFNGGTSTRTEKSSVLGDIVGAVGNVGAAAATAGAFSDPALKTDIIKLGTEPDGLGWYEYSLLGSDEREVGVMADEVAKLRPWALGPKVGGYMTVHYEMLEAA